MGIFGRKDDPDGGGPEAELSATAARLAALTLDELADELLRGTFGPGAPGEGQVMSTPAILKPYDPTGSGHFAGLPHTMWREVEWLVEEGLQHLEHRGLVVMSVTGGSNTYMSFRTSRAGVAHLASG